MRINLEILMGREPESDREPRLVGMLMAVAPMLVSLFTPKPPEPCLECMCRGAKMDGDKPPERPAWMPTTP